MARKKKAATASPTKKKTDADVVVKNPEPIPRTTKAARKPVAKIADAYKIDMRMPEYHGEFKMVDFVDGVGVFSRETLRDRKPYWFDRKTGEQIKGVTFEQYIDAWRTRGAIVTPIAQKNETPKKE